MKSAVIVFPGSNCDTDLYHALNDFTDAESVDYVPYTETDVSGYDAIFLPGGFSYGDYLRTGAIARFAPVMKSVIEEARKGKTIVGICNGFQILLEAGLLPGAMKRNKELKYICKTVSLRVKSSDTRFTTGYKQEEMLRIPIAHGEGNYECNEETYEQLKKNKQIVFTYESNINGSTGNIAGITNEKGNVLGMMPHPERAMETILGSEDGRRLFTSVYQNWRDTHVAAT